MPDHLDDVPSLFVLFGDNCGDAESDHRWL
jgi:hypothetical protein